MAYNNYFPAGYPQYIPYQQQMQNYPQQPQSNFIWVTGINGAKSFQVAPNQTVQLWDSEGNTLYIKSADQNGMPTMKILDYTIRNTETPNSVMKDMSAYVTRDEFESAIAEIRKVQNESVIQTVRSTGSFNEQ